MTKYTVEWSTFGHFQIEADDLQQAEDIAQEHVTDMLFGLNEDGTDIRVYG